MARDKVTITLDRSKAEDARALTGTRSTSEVIDLALERLIKDERLRRDLNAYRLRPPTPVEAGIAAVADREALADETDWEDLYAERD